MPKLPKTPKTSRKAALAAWLAEHRPSCISETERDQIQLALSPISGRYLHGLLRKCGVTLTPMVDGVRQGTLDELETSLLALLDEYSPGKVARRKQVRQIVIEAKRHASFALARTKDPESHTLKQETFLWLTTGLENPALFAQWVELRRHYLADNS